ncbi:hypothetical protein ACFE04_029475 [Oxalis oulophora]
MSDTIDLSGDGGVIKKITKRAKPDAIAPSDDLPLADVHYEGRLEESGEVFDSTREDNTIFSFEVGTGSVIKAWDLAVKTMKVGEIAEITCKADYAYGSAGSPPDIPPEATLIFEVELVACRPRKGATLDSISGDKARLEELRKQRELAASVKEEEKKRREEAKAAAAARIQAKLDAKKGSGKGKGKSKIRWPSLRGKDLSRKPSEIMHEVSWHRHHNSQSKNSTRPWTNARKVETPFNW